MRFAGKAERSSLLCAPADGARQQAVVMTQQTDRFGQIFRFDQRTDHARRDELFVNDDGRDDVEFQMMSGIKWPRSMVMLPARFRPKKKLGPSTNPLA